ncbi:MAG: DUF3408 domain-containing protein [Dysgonomonas sp.]
MEKEKNKSKNEEKDTLMEAGQKAEVKINSNAFIRQISLSGSNADRQEDMPVSKQASMEQNTEDAADSENEIHIPEEPKTKEQSKRRKGQPTAIDYESVFLARNELSNRQGLYIDKENYEVLQTLVRSIRSERLSVSGLVDNIIRHHIELYGDEINRIFEENIRKPIK